MQTNQTPESLAEDLHKLREFCDVREGNDWRHVGGVIHRTIASLRDMAVSGAKDAERLDYLLPNLHPANFGMEFRGGYEWDSEAEFLEKWRGAIDAAIAAKKRGGA